ncbi:hypothetical protein CYMTET_24850, partial [Cymbomonas tetramitiformis]
ELGFPLGSTPEPEAPVAVSDVGVAPEGERTFVLEVGTEELPAQEVSSAARQLQALMSDLLTKQNLAHGDVTVGATPRRVTVTVQALQSRQPDRSNRMRGPPAKIAFDAEGKPSKAAEGFCRKNGVPLEKVERAADDKGQEYLWAVVEQKEELMLGGGLQVRKSKCSGGGLLAV